ncbi:hypothetical protein F5887DRAFT_975409 [Amanita rubescens]|nr:hypothetical protein F5887DRAFT_975409 [Amanita rubescens]
MHDLLVTFQSELQKEWVDALDRLGQMHGLLSDVQHSINVSSAAIRFLDKEVISLQDKQSRISATAENLHNTVVSITASTSLELQKINATVHSIGSTFDSLPYGEYWPMMEDIVYRVLSYTWLGFYVLLKKVLYDNSWISELGGNEPQALRSSANSNHPKNIAFCPVCCHEPTGSCLFISKISASIFCKPCWRDSVLSIVMPVYQYVSDWFPSSTQLYLQRSSDDVTRRMRVHVSRIPDRLYRG